jgi:hypothetical protein
MERIAYDEFGLFHENAAEYGLPFTSPPVVRRVEVSVAEGRAVSALVWDDAPAEVVFIHGGSQNAHRGRIFDSRWGWCPARSQPLLPWTLFP